MNQDQTSNHGNQFRSAMGMLMFIVRSFAVSLELFLHRLDSFGERYLGLQVLGAFGLILFWPLLCDPRGDAMPLLLFLGSFLFMCLCARGQTSLRVRRGKVQLHSRYNGTPRVMWFFRRMNEVKVKCWVEPVIAYFIGAFTLAVSPPLGGYLMVASLSLLISNHASDRFERERAVDLYDAYVEQQSVVERFRDMRGE